MNIYNGNFFYDFKMKEHNTSYLQNETNTLRQFSVLGSTLKKPEAHLGKKKGNYLILRAYSESGTFLNTH